MDKVLALPDTQEPMVTVRPVQALAEFVKARRESLGLSQAQLAAKAGVSKASISMLEAGHLGGLPRVEHLLGIAAGLRVEPAALFTLAGVPLAPSLSADELALLQRYTELPPDDRGEVLDWMELKLRRHRKKPPSGPPEGDLGRQ